MVFCKKIKIALMLVILALSVASCGHLTEPTSPVKLIDIGIENEYKHAVSGLTFTVGSTEYLITSGFIVDSEYEPIYKFEYLIDSSGNEITPSDDDFLSWSEKAVYSPVSDATKISSSDFIFIEAKNTVASSSRLGLYSAGSATIYGGSAVDSVSSIATAELNTQSATLLNNLKNQKGKTGFMGGQTTTFDNSAKLLIFDVMGFVVYYEFAGMATQTDEGSSLRGGDGVVISDGGAYYRLIEEYDAPMNLGRYFGWDFNAGEHKVYIGNSAAGGVTDYTDENDPTTAIKSWDDINPYLFTAGI